VAWSRGLSHPGRTSCHCANQFSARSLTVSVFRPRKSNFTRRHSAYFHVNCEAGRFGQRIVVKRCDLTSGRSAIHAPACVAFRRSGKAPSGPGAILISSPTRGFFEGFSSSNLSASSSMALAVWAAGRIERDQAWPAGRPGNNGICITRPTSRTTALAAGGTG